ncbi:ABC transporter permease [Streptomyces sp. NPDC001351]|uniref:ABC transporter permease n=1 Tax=Streptomyces sp. NPDC001351 TaxID=3364564 RepID=UPI0036C3323D
MRGDELVLLTIAGAWHGRLRLARDITVAAARAALQLAAVGALLLLVFRHTGLAGAIGRLALTVLIADRVIARRTPALPRAPLTATVGITLGTAATMGTLLALGVIATRARVVIPVGGMIVSGFISLPGAMTGLILAGVDPSPRSDTRWS